MMKVLDSGHLYALQHLDDQGFDLLRFVKRVGTGYPGNETQYAGTTTQEVLRALIDRTQYVNNQETCSENAEVIIYLRKAIIALERRAAHRAGRALMFGNEPEKEPTCPVCGHIGEPHVHLEVR